MLSVAQERRHRRRGLVPTALKASALVSRHGRWSLTDTPDMQSLPMALDQMMSLPDRRVAQTSSLSTPPTPFDIETPPQEDMPVDPVTESNENFDTLCSHLLTSSTASLLTLWDQNIRSRQQEPEDQDLEELEVEPEEEVDDEFIGEQEQEEYVSISAWDRLSEDFLRQGLPKGVLYYLLRKTPETHVFVISL